MCVNGVSPQEYLIGISGGLVVNGYANGDPVNFSDPFGLCKEEDEVCARLVADLRENSESKDDIFATTADWLDTFETGSVLIRTADEYDRLHSSVGTRWGSAPSARSGDGSLYINSGQRRGSQLITAIHEVGHENGVRHGVEMREMEKNVYKTLLPSFRTSALRHFHKLLPWFPGQLKRPGGGR